MQVPMLAAHSASILKFECVRLGKGSLETYMEWLSTQDTQHIGMLSIDHSLIILYLFF